MTQPVAVRYAWADNPEATLRNGEGTAGVALPDGRLAGADVAPAERPDEAPGRPP